MLTLVTRDKRKKHDIIDFQGSEYIVTVSRSSLTTYRIQQRKHLR